MLITSESRPGTAPCGLHCCRRDRRGRKEQPRRQGNGNVRTHPKHRASYAKDRTATIRICVCGTIRYLYLPKFTRRDLSYKLATPFDSTAS